MKTTILKATDVVIALAEKNGGNITPELVVEEAKRKSSPLHAFFTWDDSEAAEQFRLIQAGHLIRRIKVTVQTAPEKTVRVRAFVNIHEASNHEEDSGGRGIYVPVQDALRNDDWRAQVIACCTRDILAFKRKYAALDEAADIINAMEHFTLTYQD